MKTTTPCPVDQSALVAPATSGLAAAALACGVAAEDVRAFLTARYRLVRTDCGLMAVSG